MFLFSRSAHYNNLEKQEEEDKLKNPTSNNNNNSNNSNNNTLTTSPLKDNSNIKTARKSLEIVNQSPNTSSETREVPKANKVNISPASTSNSTKSNIPLIPKSVQPRKLPTLNQKSSTVTHERPLKCLETLAQKAGITFSDKIELSQFKMDKGQGQTQQVTSQPMPIQISSEQFQQLQQQFQLQQAFAAGGGQSIQVKQEFPQQQQNTITAEQLNKQIQDQQNQAHQVQQMQIIDASNQQHQAQGIKYVNGKHYALFFFFF